METQPNLSRSEINNFLTRRLGEKEAGEIMTYIDSEVKSEVSAKVDDSKNQMLSWKEQMNTVFATKDDAKDLQLKLVKRVSKSESTLILWSFVFWITALIAVLCFLKFYK